MNHLQTYIFDLGYVLILFNFIQIKPLHTPHKLNYLLYRLILTPEYIYTIRL